MVCIYCGKETQVTNSRLQKRANQTWRRRQCQTCTNTFTTYEIADLTGSISVRYAPTDIRPFSRDTLYISVYETCKHRPQAIEDATHLAATTVATLLKHNTHGIIDRQEIVDTCMAILGRFDTVAATMYQAYHKKQ